MIKAGNVFAVTRRDGSLPPDGPLGVYADDCRFLSRHELRVAGAQPRLLVASAQTGSAAVHELTNPALPGASAPALRIRVERRLDGDGSGGADPRAVVSPCAAGSRSDRAARRRLRADARDPRHPGAPRRRGRRRAGRARAALLPRRPRRADAIDHGEAADRECEAAGGELRFALALAPGAEEAITLRYALRRPRGGRRRGARPAAGAERRRSPRTTPCSTWCWSARCSTSGCCTRAFRARPTTRPACRGTRRCSAATR